LSISFKNIKKYQAPKQDNIAVCTVFFNAGKFIKPVMNQLYVANILKKSNIPHYTMELVYDGEEPFFSENETTFHVRANSYMFHKENLLNLLVSKLPEKYTKIVCLDGDVLFENEDWINDTIDKLDGYDVVVPFHDAYRIDPYYDTLFECAKTLLDLTYAVKTTTFSAGYAIAFNRRFFDQIGLYEYAIIGGGDKMTLIDFIRLPLQIQSFGSTKKDDYIKKIKALNLKFGYLEGILYHLYHGSLNNRQYFERHFIIKDLHLDTDVVKNKDGVLEFVNPKKYNPIMLGYFKNRKEDYVDSNRF